MTDLWAADLMFAFVLALIGVDKAIVHRWPRLARRRTTVTKELLIASGAGLLVALVAIIALAAPTGGPLAALLVGVGLMAIMWVLMLQKYRRQNSRPE